MKKLFIPLTILTITSLYADHKENSTFVEDIIDSTKDFRKSIHSSIINTSSNVDNFFFDEKLENINYSSAYGLLELSLSQNEHENVRFDQKFRIKLKLPRLKDQMSLEIESDEERESIDFVENKNSNSKNDNINLALGYYHKLKNEINFSAKAGLKIKSTFDPFIKFDAYRTTNINNYYYTLGQIIKHSKTKETEAITYINVDKPLNEVFSLHNVNQYYWQSKNKHDSEFYNAIYLNQKLSNMSYLRYTVNANTDNIDSDLKVKRYALNVKYRHFLRKWLYLDTIPENYYREDENFKARYGIRFNLGMYFNQDSYK